MKSTITSAKNTTTTETAEILRRRLILPVRAARAGLNGDVEIAAETAARVQDQVIPALDTAADQVAAQRGRVEKRMAKKGRSGETPAAKQLRAKALASALATVDSVHQDLTDAIAGLDR